MHRAPLERAISMQNQSRNHVRPADSADPDKDTGQVAYIDHFATEMERVEHLFVAPAIQMFNKFNRFGPRTLSGSVSMLGAYVMSVSQAGLFNMGGGSLIWCFSPYLAFFAPFSRFFHPFAGLFNMGIPHITHIKLLWGKKN